MKNIYTLLIFLLLLSNRLSSQNKKPQLHDKKFSYEIKSEVESGKLTKTRAAYYSTYIGKYQDALTYYEFPLDWGLDSISEIDRIKFSEYEPVNAFEYLQGILSDQDLVIISEAHHMPQHRVFTKELLSELYENGFRHLGLETLTPSYGDTTKYLMDTKLTDRTYPLNSPMSGFYTREVQMSNLVREAIKLGFEIFAYEKTDRKSERDLQQARNIEKYMNVHPNEKIAIHCGWYHAIESDNPKKKSDNYMAYHLKKSTGINPLTIYQDALTDRSPSTNSPYYSLIDTDEISVLVDQNGKVFNGMSDNPNFDIFIYHPKNSYQKHRPNWLYNKEEIQFVKIDTDKLEQLEFPILIEAFPADEKFSVPLDIIEKTSLDDDIELLLIPGEYKITITDKNREILQFSITVE